MSLIVCRHRFYRKGALLHERLTPGWIAAVSLALASSLYLGLFVHKHVEYSSSLWWEFAFHGDAPRFLRASVGAVIMLLLFTVWKLMSPVRPQPAEQSAESLEKAAAIVRQSVRTSAQLALLGDKSFLFNQAGTGFIMYATQGRSWIAMGDPVGPEEERAELVWDFRELVDQYDGWPVFYQVAEECLPIYLDQGLTLLKLGEEARVPLPDFSLEGGDRKGLRQTYHRGQRAQVEFAVLAAEQVPAMLPELKTISDAWLAEKTAYREGLFTRFLRRTVPEPIPLRGRARCGPHRRLRQPVVRCPSRGVVDRRDAFDARIPCQDVMEYLFIELMLWGRQEGYQWFNLGMAPLSGVDDRPLAPLWNRAVHLALQPRRPLLQLRRAEEVQGEVPSGVATKYLASPGGIALPRILTDLTALIAKEHTSDRP